MSAPAAAPERIVVVGASVAGVHAAVELRRCGYAGRLTMIGDEPHRPYDRPPLSKVIAAGRMEPGHEELPLPAGVDVDWRLGVPATGLDRPNRTVLLEDGDAVPYDRVLVATGTRSRPWPDPDETALDGVLTIRNREDGIELRSRLDAGPRRVVVVGAGFTGCEIASVCRERGIEVTLLERSGQPLQAALGQTVGAAVAALQRRAGVDLRTRVGIRSFIGDVAGRVTAVALSDGETVAADLVVVGIGTMRNIEWLGGSGLTCSRLGLHCDGRLRAVTRDGGVDEVVYAAGDVAASPRPRFGNRLVAVEHWGNAVDQGRHVARSMLGLGSRGGQAGVFDLVPRFWSNQFGLSIKSVGVPSWADSIQVTQGTLEGLRGVVAYGRDGHLCGAVAINAPRELEAYDELVASPFPPDIVATEWRGRARPDVVPARIPGRGKSSHEAPAEIFDPAVPDLPAALGVHDFDPALAAMTVARSSAGTDPRNP